MKCPKCKKQVDKVEYHIYNESVEQMCPHCWSFMDAKPDPVEAFWAWMFLIIVICAGIGYLIGMILWNL